MNLLVGLYYEFCTLLTYDNNDNDDNYNDDDDNEDDDDNDVTRNRS